MTASPESPTAVQSDLAEYLPPSVRKQLVVQTAIPAIAQDEAKIKDIEEAVRHVPSTHRLIRADARQALKDLPDDSVHLVVTSPPYWNLKRYNDGAAQLGHMEDLDEFLTELDRVWAECYRVLVPGGRVVCVVGDVLRSRRKNAGRHTVVPLHTAIQEHCRALGFDNLAPIIWNKIGNAIYEAGGGGFLGKPYGHTTTNIFSVNVLAEALEQVT